MPLLVGIAREDIVCHDEAHLETSTTDRDGYRFDAKDSNGHRIAAPVHRAMFVRERALCEDPERYLICKNGADAVGDLWGLIPRFDLRINPDMSLVDCSQNK